MSATGYILPGDSIPLDDVQRKALSRRIMALIESCEAEHSQYVRRIDTWWRQYNAVPLYARRSEPFADSSNIVVPLARIHSDALSSRGFNSMLATKDTWAAARHNEDLGEGPKRWIDFLNVGANGNEFDIHRPTLGWWREAIPIGEAVLQYGWGLKTQSLFDPTSLRAGRTPRIQEVTIHQGPTLDWVPRKQIMKQAGRSFVDTEYVIKQCAMTWSQIATQTRGQGKWNREAVGRIKGRSLLYAPGPSMRMGSSSFSSMPNIGPEEFQPYDIREVWIDLPALQGFGLDLFTSDDARRFLAPSIVVHIHRDSGEVLGVMAKPYAVLGFPFLDLSFRGEGSYGHEVGVCQLLEHMQAGASTALNQAFDAVTIANSIFMITNDRDLLDKKFAPNKILFTPDPSEAGVRVLQLPKLIQPDLALVQTLLAIAERVVPAFDREGRSGGHPSPATSTLTLLQESKETLRSTLKMARMQFGRLAESLLVLYQQFLTQEQWLDRVGRTMGIKDAQAAAAYALPEDRSVANLVGADLRALTEDLNPESARQRAVLVDQATANFYGRLLQLGELITKSGGPESPLGQIAIKFARATGESYRDILESSDIDNLERYIYDFDKKPDASRAELESRLASVAPGGAGPSVPASIEGFASESAQGVVQGNGQVA